MKLRRVRVQIRQKQLSFNGKFHPKIFDNNVLDESSTDLTMALEGISTDVRILQPFFFIHDMEKLFSKT